MALLFNGQLIEYGIGKGSARACEGLREKWICSFIIGSRGNSRGTRKATRKVTHDRSLRTVRHANIKTVGRSIRTGKTTSSSKSQCRKREMNNMGFVGKLNIGVYMPYT